MTDLLHYSSRCSGQFQVENTYGKDDSNDGTTAMGGIESRTWRRACSKEGYKKVALPASFLILFYSLDLLIRTDRKGPVKQGEEKRRQKILTCMCICGSWGWWQTLPFCCIWYKSGLVYNPGLLDRKQPVYVDSERSWDATPWIVPRTTRLDPRPVRIKSYRQLIRQHRVNFIGDGSVCVGNAEL